MSWHPKVKPVKKVYLDISNVTNTEPSILKVSPEKGLRGRRCQRSKKCASDSEIVPISRQSKLHPSQSMEEVPLITLSSARKRVDTVQSKPRRKTALEKDNASQLHYDEYFRSTVATLKKCGELPPTSVLELIPKQVTLPASYLDKTLIFDLDETLIHTVEDLRQADFSVTVKLPSGETTQAGVKIRPFTKECLLEASKHFELIVFTASERNYADPILNALDPGRNLIHHRLYREQCIVSKFGPVKDLRIFINRPLSRIAIVDNSCLSFAHQIDNGIPIRTWLGDRNDRELLNLTSYLRQLERSFDFRDCNRRKFKLCSFDQQQINLVLN